MHEGNAEPRMEPRVTTVADTAWKASVEPYRIAPVLEIPAGVIACSFCGNTRFRRSRLRWRDAWELLSLRYPLRCMRCDQRQYGSFLTAGISVEPKTHGPRIAKGGETWKAWTEASPGGLHRPMSTAFGPRATKIKPLEKMDAGRTGPGGALD